MYNNWLDISKYLHPKNRVFNELSSSEKDEFMEDFLWKIRALPSKINKIESHTKEDTSSILDYSI
jgi:hypothetical protein